MRWSVLLSEMQLLAHGVRFGQPGAKIGVYLIRRRKPEGVDMITG
jgi:hypothetical protein